MITLPSTVDVGGDDIVSAAVGKSADVVDDVMFAVAVVAVVVAVFAGDPQARGCCGGEDAS